MRVNLEPARERRVGGLIAAVRGEDPPPAERVDDQRRGDVAAVGVDFLTGAPVHLRGLELGVRLLPEQDGIAVVEGREGPGQLVARGPCGVCTTSSPNSCLADASRPIARSHSVGMPQAEVCARRFRSDPARARAPEPASWRATVRPAELAPQTTTSYRPLRGVLSLPRLVSRLGICRNGNDVRAELVQRRRRTSCVCNTLRLVAVSDATTETEPAEQQERARSRRRPPSRPRPPKAQPARQPADRGRRQARPELRRHHPSLSG